MSGNDWIKQRISEAKANLPLVTQPVLVRIGELLRGQLSTGELSTGDRTRIAKELIAEMASVPPEAEAEE